jgi:hypothetical protein
LLTDFTFFEFLSQIDLTSLLFWSWFLPFLGCGAENEYLVILCKTYRALFLWKLLSLWTDTDTFEGFKSHST